MKFRGKMIDPNCIKQFIGKQFRILLFIAVLGLKFHKSEVINDLHKFKLQEF
jgi:hypothetical protein